MRSLYSTICSLSASIPASRGCSAACKSGLRAASFAGFILRTLHPRNRWPYDFASPRAVFTSAVRARTNPARARIRLRSACAFALRCFTGQSNSGSILASRAKVCASRRSSFFRLSPISRTLRACNVRNMNPEKAEALSPELQAALQPLLAGIEAVSETIVEYNERIEKLAQQNYPEVTLLKQVKGVGTLIALTFLLTLEDPHRFGKSRDVGCYLGLQPGRRNSGQSEPQMHISKEGDPYLRTLLVQGAQHILGPFGPDCDLRRWGLKLAERGGRNGKKRAIIATARKLAVLLHRLWISGEVYEPLHNNRTAIAVAA